MPCHTAVIASVSNPRKTHLKFPPFRIQNGPDDTGPALRAAGAAQDKRYIQEATS